MASLCHISEETNFCKKIQGNSEFTNRQIESTWHWQIEIASAHRAGRQVVMVLFVPGETDSMSMVIDFSALGHLPLLCEQ